ncbi:hypothetical protein RchiOBHm_Chr1g0337621 [Rosa chinensis]|uniref:Secreted protein n=1 Tax=Rosa chinensis TaxID=74649 RepID=A0A2P6SCZ8_ROSCH|nr:hypothetical protein RchiOBHm_Chr1g0337621 [Rosa chinensis]
MSFPSFLSLLLLSYSLSQISYSSWLRCTSSSPIGLHFTDRSLVHRSSFVGVAWIICLRVCMRVCTIFSYLDLGYGDLSMDSMLLFLQGIILVGL